MFHSNPAKERSVSIPASQVKNSNSIPETDPTHIMNERPAPVDELSSKHIETDKSAEPYPARTEEVMIVSTTKEGIKINIPTEDPPEKMCTTLSNSDNQDVVFPNKEISQVVVPVDPSFDSFHANAQFLAHDIYDDDTLYHDTIESINTPAILHVSADDATSSDDLPTSQSPVIHPPADDKNPNARKELRTECNKSMPSEYDKKKKIKKNNFDKRKISNILTNSISAKLTCLQKLKCIAVTKPLP